MRFTRRVQLTGNTTFIVSLPKAWASLNNVKAGSEVYITQEEDGGLKITSSAAPVPVKEAHVILDGREDVGEIRREFISKYLAGYSVIRFNSKDRLPAENRKAIKAEAARLIGLEVVEEGSREVVVQDFFSTESLSVERAVKRAYALTVSMYEDLIQSLEKSPRNAVSISGQDDEVDRVFFLVLRQLGIALENASFLKALSLKSTDCIHYTRLITAIERTADNIAKQSLEAKNAEPDKKLVEMNKEALSVYSDAVKAFFSADKRQANNALDRKLLLAQKCEQAKEKGSPRNNLLVDKVASIAEHSAEIAEIAIDKQK